MCCFERRFEGDSYLSYAIAWVILSLATLTTVAAAISTGASTSAALQRAPCQYQCQPSLSGR